jgi:hypothetical protein
VVRGALCDTQTLLYDHVVRFRNTDLTNESGGVHIGDVGYLKEGGFIRLFSVSHSVVTTPDLDEEPSSGVLDLGATVQDTRRQPRLCMTPSVTVSTPESVTYVVGFVMRSRASCQREENLYRSSSRALSQDTGVPTTFHIHGSHGAVLVGSHDLVRHNVLHHTPLRTYMLTHYETWLEDVRKTKPNLSLEDLILISGYDTTPSAASAVYSSKTEVSTELIFTPNHTGGSLNDGSDVPCGEWSFVDPSDMDSSVDFQVSSHDVGYTSRDMDSARCAFLRGYRMRANPASTLATSSDDPLTPLFDWIFEVSCLWFSVGCAPTTLFRLNPPPLMQSHTRMICGA